MNELLIVLALSLPDSVTHRMSWGETVTVTAREAKSLEVMEHFLKAATEARTRDRKARRKEPEHGLRR